jgi:F-type H+-transporting ATPase subunit gamma
MSDTTASLRRKIDGAKDLRSVVSTMKALAAASIGQYEKSARALDDYYRTVQLGLSVCFRANTPPLPASRMTSATSVTSMTPATGREGKKDFGITGAVIFGSDQGLVGQFNDVIADYAVEMLSALPGRKKAWAVGERVHDCLVHTGSHEEQHAGLHTDLSLAGLFTVPLSIKAITPLVGQILVQIMAESEAQRERGKRREGMELYLFYNSTRSGAIYEPVSQRLLPLDKTWRRQLAGLSWPTRNLPEVMGGSTATLQALIREYLFVSLFRACAESLASENASRLAAMERAEKNIDQLSADLQQTFHRLRQSKIDEELFDVISGVEALAGAGARKAKHQPD